MAYPTTPVLDTFNRADGALTAPWGGGAGGLSVSSNQCAGSGSASQQYQVSYGPACEAYCAIPVKPGNGNYVLVGARFVTGGGYAVSHEQASSTDTMAIYRNDGGAWTQLGAAVSQELAAGDSIGIECSGSTITLHYKPAAGAWTAPASRSDATFTAAGTLYLEISGSAARVDNFAGGTVAASVPAAVAAAAGSAAAGAPAPGVSGAAKVTGAAGLAVAAAPVAAVKGCAFVTAFGGAGLAGITTPEVTGRTGGQALVQAAAAAALADASGPAATGRALAAGSAGSGAAGVTAPRASGAALAAAVALVAAAAMPGPWAGHLAQPVTPAERILPIRGEDRQDAVLAEARAVWVLYEERIVRGE